MPMIAKRRMCSELDDSMSMLTWCVNLDRDTPTILSNTRVPRDTCLSLRASTCLRTVCACISTLPTSAACLVAYSDVPRRQLCGTVAMS